MGMKVLMINGSPHEAGSTFTALSEMWKGGGQGCQNMVVVTLGTGVGGGVIVNGKIISGHIGAAGEIGHIHIVDGETEACGCGNYGCLEQYASATGIVRLAKRRLAKDNKASVLRTVEKLTAKEVFDAVKAGDEFVILAMGLDEEGAKEYCTSIYSEVEDYNKMHNLPSPLSVTIGYVVRIPNEGASLDDAIEDADKNMFVSKREKGNY